MNADHAAAILASALFESLKTISDDRYKSCTAMGIVHKVTWGSGVKEDWLIRFVPDSGDFSIEQVKEGMYKDGDLLYWHDTDEDTATQAALHGDRVITEDVSPDDK